MIGRPPESLDKRFWKMVNKTDSCWLWTGKLHRTGYGLISDMINGKRKDIRAHRVSYKIHHGSLPDDMFVCHTCDTRNCVNPAHLFLGTNQENVNDMVQKKRQAHGSKNGHSKLSPEQVSEIMTSTETQTELAKRYGVCQSQISRIKTGITYSIQTGTRKTKKVS